MNKWLIRSIIYYGMIGILGVILLFVGVMFQSKNILSNRLIWSGAALLVIGLLFMVITLLVRKRSVGNKGFKKLYDCHNDERTQLIVGKSSSMTLDLMLVISMISCAIFSFLGLYSFVYITVSYLVISSILQFGISMYLRYKF